MDDVMPTVFMVEDTRDVRVALSRMLTAAGYEVRSFESAEHFLSDQEPGHRAVCCSMFACRD